MQTHAIHTITHVDDALYRSPFSYVLGDGRHCSLTLSQAQLTLEVGGQPALRLDVHLDGQQVRLRATHPLVSPVPAQALLPVLAEFFCRPMQLDALSLELAVTPTWAVQAVREGVFDQVEPLADGCRLQVCRASFWQHPALWLRQGASGFAQRFTLTANHRHPVRPPKPEGVVYERHLPHLNLTFSLRTLDIEQDLITFNRWMNLPNVASVWDQADDTQTHAQFLAAQQADPHTQTLFGCFNGEPFAYFELYWVKEDRLAPFCQAGDYDRGIHILVGNRRHQGPAKLEAWLRSLFHYAFLDDPRTQTVYGEPRIDNQRWIAYMQEQGGVKLREFDFPHKRAALISLARETFFQEYGPR